MVDARRTVRLFLRELSGAIQHLGRCRTDDSRPAYQQSANGTNLYCLSYRLCSVSNSGGFLGDKLGPRITLAASALVWCFVTVLTGLLPAVLGGSLAAILVALWLIRFSLGIAEATTFPVGNRVVRNWLPPSERAFGSSLMMMGTCAASAVTSPLVSWLMLRFGWKESFYLTSLPALLIAFLWYRFSRDTPQRHPGVNPAELAHIHGSSGSTATAAVETPFRNF